MVANVWGQLNYINPWGQPYINPMQQPLQFFNYGNSFGYNTIFGQQYSQINNQQAYMFGMIMGIRARQTVLQQMMAQQAQMAAYAQQAQQAQQNQQAQTDNEQETEVASKSEKSEPEKSEKTETPAKPEKSTTEVKSQTLTKDLKNQIIAGTYSGQYIKVNGVTHYRYADCEPSKRVSVGNGQQLHKDAAAAFNKMKAAAAKDGISLHVHSGLRTVATQKGLFSSKMKTKGRSFEQNVVWSAPANFSEHHTGLAMDINCASTSFGKSKEYKWLKAHAKDFGFELSFPENNAQGVGFEPWHWRFVGENGEYKSVFAAARGNDPRFNK